MVAVGSDGDPFLLGTQEPIRLLRAPLDRVLCQVRWPELTGFAQRFDSIGDSIGLQLAEDYPLFTKRQEANFILGPSGVAAQPGIFVYQWSTANTVWSVHFAPNFLSIETSRYTTKEDLLDRLQQVLAVVRDAARIPHYIRVGYRYTNRVTGVADINELIRPEVRGGGAVPLGPGASLIQSVTETLYRVDEDMLLARWAQLPAGATIDPAIPPLQAESWVLDLDTFNESGASDFEPAEIAATALRLARRGYTFFRWSVTDQFLALFGAA
jgi:uncharacterized protein (TIGR04255 family)